MLAPCMRAQHGYRHVVCRPRPTPHDSIAERPTPHTPRLGRPHRCFAIGLFLDLRCQSRFFDVWWPRIFNDKGLRWSGPLRPIEMFISY